jgi:hypothetical protein
MTLCSRGVDLVVLDVSNSRSALIFKVKQSKKKNWIWSLDPADGDTTNIRADENDKPSATVTTSCTISCSETSPWQPQKLKIISSFWKGIETNQEELVAVICFRNVTANFTFLFSLFWFYKLEGEIQTFPRFFPAVKMSNSASRLNIFCLGKQ